MFIFERPIQITFPNSFGISNKVCYLLSSILDKLPTRMNG